MTEEVIRKKSEELVAQIKDVRTFKYVSVCYRDFFSAVTFEDTQTTYGFAGNNVIDFIIRTLCSFRLYGTHIDFPNDSSTVILKFETTYLVLKRLESLDTNSILLINNYDTETNQYDLSEQENKRLILIK